MCAGAVCSSPVHAYLAAGAKLLTPLSGMVTSCVIVLQDALQPVNAALWSGFRNLASLVSSQPDLKFQIPRSAGASSWLLNTYLDKACPHIAARSSDPFQSLRPSDQNEGRLKRLSACQHVRMSAMLMMQRPAQHAMQEHEASPGNLSAAIAVHDHSLLVSQKHASPFAPAQCLQHRIAHEAFPSSFSPFGLLTLILHSH